MTIASMQKVQIYTHLSSTSALLRDLQRLAILEITDIDKEFMIPLCPGGLCGADLEKLLDFLKQIFPTEKSFIENFINCQTILAVEEFFNVIKSDKKIIKLAKELNGFKDNWQELQKNINLLAVEIEKLERYSSFKISSKNLQKLKKVKLSFGILSRRAFERFQGDEQNNPIDWHYEVLNQNEKNVYLAIASLPAAEAGWREVLAGFGLEEVVLPVMAKPFAELLAKAKIRRQELGKAEQELKNKLLNFYTEHKETLLVWADYLKNEEKLQLWSGNLLKTKKVTLIEGWLVKSRFTELAAVVKKYEKDAFLIEAVHTADEQPPIALENNKAESFEAVTAIYGFPHQQELDPTPFLSVFFIIFYGLCLSDFGYGLMLFLFARYLLSKYKKQLTSFGKKLLRLNSYCGISTMVVGILMGSYFGIDLTKLTYQPVKDLLLHLRILDPITNPLPMLILSVVLGITQIYTGLWLRFFIDWRQKGLKEGILLSGLWVFFSTGLIGWVLTGLVFKLPVLALFFKLIVWTGTIALILTQGRHHKNPLMRLWSGILSLYRLTGFVGDILSYSRLFALGLVTAVLSSVINLLAGMTGGIPLVGWLVMATILIFGHIFDFLINILGAFVHSARLQYVEYFSKFFEGGGRVFKPFTWKTKYIKVE